MRQTRTRAPALLAAGVLAAGVLAAAAACAGQSGAVASAVVNTAIAATASGVQRAQGGCYANCPPGTVCNPATGYCDEQPCRGQCMDWEECDTQAPIPRCIRRQDPALKIGGTRTTGTRAPADAPVAPPPDAGR